jgi:hypothetical protein
VASVALGVLGSVRTISACRCVEPSAPAEAYRAADAVVLAKVVKLEPRPELGGFSISLFVERAWKSEVNQELSITTGSDCLYSTEPEQKYVLFLARASDRTFTTGQCMGNRPLGKGDKLIRWFQDKAKAAQVIPPTCQSCHPGLP